MGKTGKRLAIGTVAAGVAGYLAGILTAPKSGKETRADIKNAATASMVEAEKQLKKLHTQLSSVINEAKDQAGNVSDKARKGFDDAVDKTKVVREKARDLLSALHEGGANDKELREAIDEANKAIAHLRTFLKKQA